MVIDNVLQLIFQHFLGSSVPPQRSIFRQDALLLLFTDMGPLHIY